MMNIICSLISILVFIIPSYSIANSTGPGGSTGQQYIGSSSSGSTSGGVVRQSANCAAATGGSTSEQCQDTVLNTLFICETGPCNGSGWVTYSGASSGGIVDTIAGDAVSPVTSSADVKFVGGSFIDIAVTSAANLEIDLDGQAAKCDALIDFDTYADNTAGTAQAFDDLQDAINTWAVTWTDTDGDSRNDPKTVCTTGEVTIRSSAEANPRYAYNGTLNSAGFSDFISLAQSKDTAMGGACGEHGNGSPIGCDNQTWIETSGRLTLDLGSTVFRVDRSSWPASPVSVLIHVGDMYAAGSVSSGGDMYGLRASNARVVFIGDGDGTTATAPSNLPFIAMEQSPTTLLSDTTAFVALFYDGAQRVEDSDFNIRIDGSTDTTEIAKDSTTVGMWVRESWTSLSGNYDIYGTGVNYLQHGAVNVRDVMNGSMRAGHIGFQFGDPEYGCDIVYSSVNASGSTQLDKTCSGLVFTGTYEGTQNLQFGHFGKITFKDSYAEPRQQNAFFHQWLLSAGKNSSTSEVCWSDAHADSVAPMTQTCDTPYEAAGSAIGDGTAYGTLLFSGGGIGIEYTGDATDGLYSMAIGNNPNSLVLVYDDSFGGGRNTTPSSGSVYVPFACIGDAGCVGMQFIRGTDYDSGFADGTTDPAFTGDNLYIPRTYIGVSQTNWTENDLARPDHGDLAIITPDGISDPHMYVCLNEAEGSCASGDWQALEPATIPFTHCSGIYAPTSSIATDMDIDAIFHVSGTAVLERTWCKVDAGSVEIKLFSNGNDVMGGALPCNTTGNNAVYTFNMNYGASTQSIDLDVDSIVSGTQDQLSYCLEGYIVP